MRFKSCTYSPKSRSDPCLFCIYITCLCAWCFCFAIWGPCQTMCSINWALCCNFMCIHQNPDFRLLQGPSTSLSKLFCAALLSSLRRWCNSVIRFDATLKRYLHTAIRWWALLLRCRWPCSASGPPALPTPGRCRRRRNTAAWENDAQEAIKVDEGEKCVKRLCVVKGKWTYGVDAAELDSGAGDDQSQHLPSHTARAEDVLHGLGLLSLRALSLFLHVVQLQLQVVLLPQPLQRFHEHTQAHTRVTNTR